MIEPTVTDGQAASLPVPPQPAPAAPVPGDRPAGGQRPAPAQRPAASQRLAASDRPAVMADVARLAGVSHMTVSRVLNDSQAVSPTTRARVRAAMTTLGYRPNTAARALVTGRTRQLGVVSVNTTLFGPASMLVAIERAARDAGYAVSIASLRAPDQRSLGEAFEHLIAQSVEGIIAITPQAAIASALRSAPSGIPLVAVEGGEGPMPTVAVDQYLGAVRATRFLLALGHQRIAHIAGPDDWHEAGERERGWRDSLLAAGIEPAPVLRGDWSPRAGYEAGLALAENRDLTAVFVANDQMAIGVLRAFAESGIDIPGDVSVVGFDDIPEAAYFAPPLTTLRQDFGEVGRRSLALLVDQVEGAPRSNKRLVIPPDLVVRDSTGPAAAGPATFADRASVGSGTAGKRSEPAATTLVAPDGN